MMPVRGWWGLSVAFVVVLASSPANADDDGLTDLELAALCAVQVDEAFRQVRELQDSAAKNAEDRKKFANERRGASRQRQVEIDDNLAGLDAEERTLREYRAAGWTEERVESARVVESVQRKCADDPAAKQALGRVCGAWAAQTLIDWSDVATVRQCTKGARSALEVAARDLPAAMKRDLDASSRAVDSRAAEPARGLGGAALQTAILRGAAEFFVTRAEQELSLFAAEFVGSKLCDEEAKFGALKLADVFEHTCELLNPENGPALGATPAALREAARADLEALPERLAVAFPAKSPTRCGIALGWRFAREAVQGADIAVLLSDPEALANDLPAESCSDEMLVRLKEIAEEIAKVRRSPGVNVASAVRSGSLDFLVSRSGNFVVRSAAPRAGESAPSGSESPALHPPAPGSQGNGQPAVQPPPTSGSAASPSAPAPAVQPRPQTGVNQPAQPGASSSEPADSMQPTAAGEPANSDSGPARAPQLSNKGETIKEVLRRLGELDRAVRAWEAKPERAQTAAMVAAGLRCVEPVLRYVTGADKDALADLTLAIRGVEQIGARQYVAAVVTFGKLSVLAPTVEAAKEQPTVKALVGLGATLAQADSREAVRTAFEDAALPLQSWRRKNADRWGFTLTGFVGFHGAHEFVLGEAGSAEPDDGWTVAPALMVGVDVHHGIGGAWRFGTHLNVLDLGALASIRLDDARNEESTSDEEPDVRVEQVFAPGVFVYLGDGPFAFGPEVSFVPSLRETRARAGGAREALDVLRFGLVLSVDVSVLPLL